MSIANYLKTCAKSISGCKLIFIAEAANVTSVTITAGEITALTGNGAFKQIEADDDTIIREQEKLDSRLEIFEHRVGFKVNKLSKDLNTLRDSIANASPCGMLSIVVDNNGKAWLVGYSEEDGIKRPLYLFEDKDSTLATPFEGDPTAELNLKRTTGHIDLPFDDTLTAAIIAKTAIFIAYTDYWWGINIVPIASSKFDTNGISYWTGVDITLTWDGTNKWMIGTIAAATQIIQNGAGQATIGHKYHHKFIAKSPTLTNTLVDNLSSYYNNIVIFNNPSLSTEFQIYEFTGDAINNNHYLTNINQANGTIIHFDDILIVDIT